MSELLIEVCCGSAEAAVVASRAGAHRVELCDNLIEGGTTPSVGAVRLAAERSGLPVFAMVRPRGGDFLYSGLEYDVMLEDVVALRDAGAAGLVFGLLHPDGTVDRDRTEHLIRAARPCPVTFHRAFDLSADLEESLEILIDLGVDRVLTSAGAPRVMDGFVRLTKLVEQASGRITILPGGGIRPEDVTRLAREAGVRELHIGASTVRPSLMRHRLDGVPMGSGRTPNEYEVEVADEARIAGTVQAARRVMESGRE